MWFICCNVTAVIKNILAAPKTSFDKGSMFINRILGHTHANITRAVWQQESLFHRLVSLATFLMNNMGVIFAVSIRIIDGADNVYSLRRKELFWQYKLGTFSPAGLNERAADIELDMFACGSA